MNAEAQSRGLTPPVFIVVCNNTNVSKLVFDYIAGWDVPDSDRVAPGRLPLFSNVEDNQWTARPNTILVDSEQLESGEGMSEEFRAIAAREVEEFKAEYRARFPGRSADDLTPEDLLREVMNTVGKPGKLGERIKCVVSVSMLTEGWDANTVTHILGVRAFGTQLLCEQVVGRGLRRMSYAANAEGRFEPEYAEVYGVPFSFLPCSGSTPEPKLGNVPTRVRSLPERADLAITFPRLTGYRWELPSEKLEATFTADSRTAISTEDVATWTENAPIVGQSSRHTLHDLRAERVQTVAFRIASHSLNTFFRDDEGGRKIWLFPQLVRITQQWIDTCVELKDGTFVQMLSITELALEASEKIYRAIVGSKTGAQLLRPIFCEYDRAGSTGGIDFDTTRATFQTRADKCHLSHVVADTDSWEQTEAQSLENMPEVLRYVKNDGRIGFKIPYTLEGETRDYIPDFIVCLDGGLQLILEITGEKKKDKEAKVSTARNLWVPSVNNHGGFGKWAFLEVRDASIVQKSIRELL